MSTFTLPEGFQLENGWVYDSSNNRVSVQLWRDEEGCYNQLLTLTGCADCSGCTNCAGCWDCSDCSDCLRCSDCSDCSGCTNCAGCADCSGCTGCSRCSGIKNASPVEDVSLDYPIIPDIHKAVYDAITNDGCSLDMRKWHICGTTHCRAGWVIHLAGEAGYALEKRTSPEFAAMMIYEASGYLISPVRFFDSDEKAMEDIKRLAGEKE